jgi:hypothetical protein
LLRRIVGRGRSRCPRVARHGTKLYLLGCRRKIAETVNDVSPTRTNISSGVYPVSSPLFIYVNGDHLTSTTGLAEYAAEFVSLCAAGANGYLLDEGLVPLSVQNLLRQRKIVARLRR